MTRVSVVISSFGDRSWAVKAKQAAASAEDQGAHEVIALHQDDATLAEVRNEAVARATGDLIVMLDADDQLAPGYVEAMTIAAGREGPAALLAPAVSYCAPGRPPQEPKFWPHGQSTNLRDGNWLLIGTGVSKAMFEAAGGFREWRIFEDWDVWQRCIAAGAFTVKVPDAVYLAHVSATSRNRSLERAECEAEHHAIRRSNFPELY